MPRSVRNFWIELNVDGRTSRVETGPVSKDGGFSLSILVRNEGSILEKHMEVQGRAMMNGDLVVTAAVVRDRQTVGKELVLKSRR